MTPRHPMRIAGAFALLFALFSSPAVAQDGNVAWFYQIDVAVADADAFEAGLEGWAERLAEDGEPWTWNVFQTVTGPSQYVIMTPGRTFGDFDRDPLVDEDRMEENDEWFQENLAPYVSNGQSVMMVLRPEISVTGGDQENPPLWNVIEWELTDGSTDAYMSLTNVFTKIRDAYSGMMEEATAAGESPMGYNIFDIRFSDGPPRMLASFPMREFGDMDGGDPLGFFQAMAEAYGHQDAVMIDATMAKYLKQVRNNIWVHRMDLSHMPDSGM